MGHNHLAIFELSSGSTSVIPETPAALWKVVEVRNCLYLRLKKRQAQLRNVIGNEIDLSSLQWTLQNRKKKQTYHGVSNYFIETQLVVIESIMLLFETINNLKFSAPDGNFPKSLNLKYVSMATCQRLEEERKSVWTRNSFSFHWKRWTRREVNTRTVLHQISSQMLLGCLGAPSHAKEDTWWTVDKFNKTMMYCHAVCAIHHILSTDTAFEFPSKTSLRVRRMVQVDANKIRYPFQYSWYYLSTTILTVRF